MSYQVIARKWRPQRFDDVVGQKAVTRTLRNAIASLASASELAVFSAGGAAGAGAGVCAAKGDARPRIKNNAEPKRAGECMS